jgi:hypothetical protein
VKITRLARQDESPLVKYCKPVHRCPPVVRMIAVLNEVQKYTAQAVRENVPSCPIAESERCKFPQGEAPFAGCAAQPDFVA